jgi:hypothetical protein
MEYSVVVRTNSVSELVNDVNRLITNGFRPIGGICAVLLNPLSTLTLNSTLEELEESAWGQSPGGCGCQAAPASWGGCDVRRSAADGRGRAEGMSPLVVLDNGNRPAREATRRPRMSCMVVLSLKLKTSILNR